jgi:hypothetical protein
MKFLSLLLPVILSAASAQAASTFKLDDIYTNNCEAAQTKVNLLNSSYAAVTTVCEPYAQGGYTAQNGKTYDYELHTTVTLNFDLPVGSSLSLADINTNNCVALKKEIAILGTSAVQVIPTCSVYMAQGYKSEAGKLYDYRLYTTVQLLK